MSHLDTMSLDDLYNHLKVYESEVQKKSEPNSQNMAFISLAKHSRRNEDVNTASVSTASTNVPTASANIGVASISQDTACAYIASQSSGKKISIQVSNVVGFDKLKVECFNYHKMVHFVRECRAPRSQDRGRRDNYRQGSKVEEQAPKVLMAIDGVGWDWSYMADDEEDHTLVADEEAPIEFALMANTSSGSKDLDNLIESQISDKNKEGLGYNAVPPPPAQIYYFPKKDLSWTGLPEFANDTVTDYSRLSPTMESTSGDDQNRNPSISETDASSSTITPKPFIKFVKPNNSPSRSKTAKHNSGNEEVNTASVSTASTNVSTASANIGVARLAQVEARLAEHRNQEVKYCEKIRIFVFKTESRANCIESLTKELELIKKEKEGLDSKLAGFQTGSKDLDNLLES
nr:hypothetical protein [Tanacetum cinerariifolium]